MNFCPLKFLINICIKICNLVTTLQFKKKQIEKFDFEYRHRHIARRHYEHRRSRRKRAFYYSVIKCYRLTRDEALDFTRIKSSATNNSDGVAVKSLKGYYGKSLQTLFASWYVLKHCQKQHDPLYLGCPCRRASIYLSDIFPSLSVSSYTALINNRDKLLVAVEELVVG